MKEIFYEEGIFHVFNKSIANYCIFRKNADKERFINTVEYYNNGKKMSYSDCNKVHQRFYPKGLLFRNNRQVVSTISYCVMQDHYHLLFKCNKDYSTTYNFINRFENSYSHYYNLKYNRKGPLWQNDYRLTEILTDDQLLHVSRYIHLNPCTKNLVSKPENWKFSSYSHYLNQKMLAAIPEISINDSDIYKKFVENNIDYQKKLHLIKNLILEK